MLILIPAVVAYRLTSPPPPPPPPPKKKKKNGHPQRRSEGYRRKASRGAQVGGWRSDLFHRLS
ncbi:hypothetical protein IE53DRAFT_169110 [Violaceomyces palustris]|uniref:Uncharacterized protein n=1 Tax=Violaceomyces palustris TaxID=1673888 RepID=A0ACD0NSZ9_9BASI|nr:hypothetical protein IE53DRAFT_169110 [Violaceomyces palustris]